MGPDREDIRPILHSTTNFLILVSISPNIVAASLYANVDVDEGTTFFDQFDYFRWVRDPSSAWFRATRRILCDRSLSASSPLVVFESKDLAWKIITDSDNF